MKRKQSGEKDLVHKNGKYKCPFRIQIHHIYGDVMWECGHESVSSIWCMVCALRVHPIDPPTDRPCIWVAAFCFIFLLSLVFIACNECHECDHK